MHILTQGARKYRKLSKSWGRKISPLQSFLFEKQKETAFIKSYVALFSFWVYKFTFLLTYIQNAFALMLANASFHVDIDLRYCSSLIKCSLIF